SFFGGSLATHVGARPISPHERKGQMPNKRPSSVPRTFDDLLAAFNARTASEGWDSKHGINLPQLESDLKHQRTGHHKDQELRQAYELYHHTFRDEEAERYHRFMSALEIIRSAYRRNPEVLKSLSVFKRQSSSSRSKRSTPSAP